MDNYHIFLDRLKKILKKKQLKFTHQREMVLKALYYNQGHFSPEEILYKIKEKNPGVKIGIATIYRTLALLEEEGLAESISFGKDGKKYEIAKNTHHDHLICIICKKIVEFVDETIEARQEAVAKKFDFKMVGHSMKIYGVCKECQKNMER
ncbi:MAG: transcriptional repressor [Epsilonproteobacteria bacterium]|nr:transcriptional repressor [Campylobacterota bacterium]